MKTTEKTAFQDLLRSSVLKAPLGLIKFSALLKNIIDIAPLDEGQKNAVIFHLCRGLIEPREYAKINPSLMTAFASDRIAEKAAAEYGRCILAKALSRVFTALVPKYKNLTAKRIFLNYFYKKFLK